MNVKSSCEVDNVSNNVVTMRAMVEAGLGVVPSVIALWQRIGGSEAPRRLSLTTPVRPALPTLVTSAVTLKSCRHVSIDSKEI
jgi:hypothetical protein